MDIIVIYIMALCILNLAQGEMSECTLCLCRLSSCCCERVVLAWASQSCTLGLCERLESESLSSCCCREPCSNAKPCNYTLIHIQLHACIRMSLSKTHKQSPGCSSACLAASSAAPISHPSMCVTSWPTAQRPPSYLSGLPAEGSHCVWTALTGPTLFLQFLTACSAVAGGEKPSQT